MTGMKMNGPGLKVENCTVESEGSDCLTKVTPALVTAEETKGFEGMNPHVQHWARENVNRYLFQEVRRLRRVSTAQTVALVLVYLVWGYQVAFGQAVAKVTGPTSGTVGAPVVLTYAGSAGAVVKWQFVGRNPPESATLFEGGMLFIPNQVGDYVLILAVADQASVDITLHTVKVSAPATPVINLKATIGGMPNQRMAVPSPAPAAPISPRINQPLIPRQLPMVQPPPKDRGRFDLAAYTERAARELVNSRHYARYCPRMAENFNEVASKIEAGDYASIPEAMGEIRRMNTIDVNGGTIAWDDFFSQIHRRYVELETENRLTTLNDLAAAFRETAKGLAIVSRIR